MDTNGTDRKIIVKKKLISASKLQPIKLNQPSANTGRHDATSLQTQIASINISQTTPTKYVEDFDLESSNHQLSANLVFNSADAQSQRFNPFNRSEESSSSSSSSVDSKSLQTTDSPNAGLAELGLAEDHFSGSLGLSSIEELNIAIVNCKEMISQVPENSKKWKKLAENIVQLKIKLQDIKDSPVQPNKNIKLILGHHLKKQKKRNLNVYCDCCRTSLWSLIPVWYECKECSFVCHEKCLDSIRRSCVAKLAKSSMYELNICPESGLSKQMYCCKECKNPISVGTGVDRGRLCDYTGYYYCSNCHWDDELVIPARVVHNWDHIPRKVCRQSYQLLNKMQKLPILNVEEINSYLFKYVEELSEIKRMRENILKMKQYLLTCKAALEAKLLRKLSNRQHFIDNSCMYSMEDLIQTHSGQLTEELLEIHRIYAKHIQLDCLACQGKGFICEICNSGGALFPFDLTVSICPRCSAVFHSDCFSFVDRSCSRCKRKQEKRSLSLSFICGGEKLSSSSDEMEIEDYKPSLPLRPVSFSPFSSWLNSRSDISDQHKINSEATKPSVYEGDLYGEKVSYTVTSSGAGKVLQQPSPSLLQTLTANDRSSNETTKNARLNPEIYDESKNPFFNDDTDSTLNPFLTNSYDETKNPFCFN